MESNKSKTIGKTDYVSRMLDYSAEFSRLVLKNFKYYLEIAGTDIIVKRVTEGEFRQALGAAYIYDGTDVRNEEQVFRKRIVINRSQLVTNYRTSQTDIEAYSNENFYKIGDQIEFQSRGVQYKYKVTDIEQFDPYNELLYKITLAGFEEYKLSDK